MRKQIFGRRFKRDVNQRKALFRNLMRSLVMNEEIKTTEAKAKSIRGQFEKLVTTAKKGELSYYHLKKELNEDAVKKMVNEIGPRFSSRPGGYTRIVKLGNRTKDNAEMALIEFVEKGEKTAEKKTPKRKDVKKRISKKNTSQETKKTEPKKENSKKTESTVKKSEAKKTKK